MQARGFDYRGKLRLVQQHLRHGLQIDEQLSLAVGQPSDEAMRKLCGG